MPPLIVEHLREVEEACRKFEVRKLELFGSGARADFDPDRSDLDFFVEFLSDDWRGSFDRYMGLKLALEDLFGRNVDLVEREAVTNPIFLEVADRHRQVLYAA